MPWSAPSICPAGHPHYRGDRCPVCVRERQAAYDRTRPSAAQRGYDEEHRRDRERFLRENPFCIECGRPAVVLEHCIPHRGDQRLLRDPANWQPMCVSCASRKTALADSAFAGLRR
jgi:5-methylcytosine-specific restriction enzyme A